MIAEAGADLAPIERALSALLSAMVDDEARWSEPALYRIRAQPFDPSKVAKTRAEAETAQLVREPVYFACRLAVRRLGAEVFALTGSTDGMRRAAENAAELVPAQFSRRLAMLDSAWDGLGSDTDRWWA